MKYVLIQEKYKKIIYFLLQKAQILMEMIMLRWQQKKERLQLLLMRLNLIQVKLVVKLILLKLMMLEKHLENLQNIIDKNFLQKWLELQALQVKLQLKIQLLLFQVVNIEFKTEGNFNNDIGCLLYTSDAADDTPCVDLGGRRIIKKTKYASRWDMNNK
eukprot:TRINITY_DN58587_c0_g1_i2.p3 TRINITY_DN58587_c0_g1~~TRINITY_DN58587_c0_g1_i2.p3  ORF type:complete len:159 (-),score=9.27 TRINITY_DN58587_c0_g1_i2:42-518(-)